MLPLAARCRQASAIRRKPVEKSFTLYAGNPSAPVSGWTFALHPTRRGPVARCTRVRRALEVCPAAIDGSTVGRGLAERLRLSPRASQPNPGRVTVTLPCGTDGQFPTSPSLFGPPQSAWCRSVGRGRFSGPADAVSSKFRPPSPGRACGDDFRSPLVNDWRAGLTAPPDTRGPPKGSLLRGPSKATVDSFPKTELRLSRLR